jgi:hypothetical protein
MIQQSGLVRQKPRAFEEYHDRQSRSWLPTVDCALYRSVGASSLARPTYLPSCQIPPVVRRGAPVSEEILSAIRELLAQCSFEEQATIFNELRERHKIHEFETVIGAPAEMILEAVHRAPELTRRMLRGVIADAAFRRFEVRKLVISGWRDVTPHGNFAYDYKLDDGIGAITIQVKLQRSEGGFPVVKDGKRYGFGDLVHIVETQKTRTGTDGDNKQTRPYRFNEFDILAVSLQPSTLRWDLYTYTLARWLLPGQRIGEMATLQPVSIIPNSFWTNDFNTAVQWFRTDDGGKSEVKDAMEKWRSQNLRSNARENKVSKRWT